MMLAVMSRLPFLVTPVRPGTRVWWVRVVITGLFLIWNQAVAVHVLTQPHEGGPGHNHSSQAGDCERGLMHSHENDCDPPHVASDHGYLLVSRVFGPMLPVAAVAVLPGWDSLEPRGELLPSLLESPHWPGADPPRLTLPRAPPSA
jgi:hypothetical protein